MAPTDSRFVVCAPGGFEAGLDGRGQDGREREVDPRLLAFVLQPIFVRAALVGAESSACVM